MKRRLLASAALPALALAACTAEPEAPEPVPEASESAVPTGLRTLVAAGFNDQQLGPKIVGPRGPEVESTVSFEGREIARIVSYVACPAPAEDAEGLQEFAETCDPAQQAEGAIYTYVHRITPAERAEGPLLSFRSTLRAHGFANTIGFDRRQAEAALGEDYQIGVQIENGALIWRIESGDGWDAGEEITVFWQGTIPPAGPAENFEVETSNGRLRATGPFPAEPAGDLGAEPSAR